MLFRALIFILLVALGYHYAGKFRGNRFGLSLVSLFLTVFLVAFFIFGKKLWAMFGFSMYIMIILLGFAAGILIGLSTRKKKLDSAKYADPVQKKLNNSN
ncbi:MAG: hypothetical protein KBD67_09075 [Anaerolineaceae bacterium]|nr:hypothetical protein [Anaerolineaceae bacterium]